MAKDIVDTVLTAEEDASKIKENADNEAHKILADAHLQSREIVRKAKKEAENDAKKIIELANKKAEEIITGGYQDEKYNSLSLKIKEGMEEAVRMITEIKGG